MTNRGRLLTAFMALAAASAAYGAPVVVDFEDLCGQAVIPSGYAGLEWDPHWFYWSWGQAPYTPSSGVSRIASHNYGGWIEFNRIVDFKGAYFSGTGTDCVFKGYLHGALVDSSGSVTVSSTPTFLVAGFASAVDKVEVVCNRFNYFAMDDLTYDPDVLPAPEYGSHALLVVALFSSTAAAYLAARRRQGER